ncbi:MAG: hypothetical protein PHI03_12735 [Bacteroidales bacterium]|nr:hypothetical protein [Bacteroidales bacterium]MDD4673791.1 hypothetical protein [Bacteroidales bacterium]MDY0349218.1 hypothetical protein [Tenuifilaceae bacterium]
MDKENFKKAAKKSLNNLFAKIDELEAKKDKVKADSKAEYEEKLARLKSQKDNLQAKYNELIKASDEKWGEVKNAFSSAADSFKEGVSKISSLF